MAKFSPDFLKKIKESVNLVEVVGEHVVLRKSGSNHSGLCPFHSERSPSFSVSETKQLYHCYGCQRGGDLVRFVMEMHALSFHQAVAELAERARIPLPADARAAIEGGATGAQASAQREKQAIAHRLNRFAAAFFHQNLTKSPEARTYFEKRGVTPEMQKLFYVGTSSAAWEQLARHLESSKAPLDVASELGLIRPSPAGKGAGGPGYFDLFRNRALFPILDLRGKVAGFGGRAMGDETPKYLNSSDSIVFQKSRLLFGLAQAQKYIREKDEAIVVEGYFDVVALHGAGICNVVATCGTALTAEHLQALKRLASRVIVLFDGDRAGIAATTRAMEMGLEQGWVLNGAPLPDGRDPDEWVLEGAEGVERLRAHLAQAPALLDESIRHAWDEGRASAEGQAQALKQISEWLRKFNDPIGRAVRVEQLRSVHGVPAALLAQVFPESRAPQAARSAGRPQASGGFPQRSGIGPGRTPPSTGASARIAPVRAPSPSERVLLEGLALGGAFSEALAAARAKLPPRTSLADLFEHPGIRDLFRRMAQEPGFLELFRGAPAVALESVEDQQVRSILTEIWVSSGSLAGIAARLETEAFALALNQRIKWIWARFSHQIREELKRAELAKDAESQAKWMQEYLDVQRKMKELGRFYDEA